MSDLVDQLNQILVPWRYAEAQLWKYHVTHWTLDICLVAPRIDNLHIVCEGVKSIVAKPYWKQANVLLLRNSDNIYDGEFCVFDEHGGLNVVCGLVRLETKRYGSSEHKFLGEVP